MAVPIPIQATQFVEDFYVYQLDFPSLAPGATATGNIQVQADSDFKLIKLTQFASIGGASQTDSTRVLPLATLLVTDSGIGRQLMSLPVPIPALFGSGEIPFILPVARIFKARASVAIQVSNYSAFDTYNIRLSLIGTKIFKIG